MDVEEKMDLEDLKLLDKYNLPKSHRKGMLGRISNFFLKKMNAVVLVFFRDMILQQEFVNQKLNEKSDYLLKLSKQNTVKVGNDANDLSEFNYFKFEADYRGEEDDIKNRLKVYLDYFKSGDQVLDVGCGRGEFLSLLSERGVRAKGIDLRDSMVDRCKSKGLDVELSDANLYLLSTKGESLDAVTAFHIVEHLTVDYLQTFLSATYKTLKKGGKLIVETPNILNLGILRGAFFVDPDHNKPVHPELLKFLAREAGFGDFEFKILSMPDDKDRLSLLEGDDKNVKIQNNNLEKINECLFGGGDYALIFKKM